jgi:nucleoside-diphosphate-sugar epimerase
MNVLITGSTGFVGSCMKDTKPDHVWAIGIGREDYEKWEWEQFNWDAIVHLAPISPNRVLQYAGKMNSRVLFVSSGAIYNRQEEYADNKRKWEIECKASGVECVIARPFCFIGEHLRLEQYAIGQFILDGLMGGPVSYYDAGCVRSYMYGADLGRWLWKILEDGESGSSYDIGASSPVSMRVVAHTVADICGCSCERIDNNQERNIQPLVYLPDVAPALKLGCYETVGLRESIERTVNAHRS